MKKLGKTTRTLKESKRTRQEDTCGIDTLTYDQQSNNIKIYFVGSYICNKQKAIKKI
jgi:hypothetical protein